MSFNSKYKGEEVEELLDSVGNKVDKIEGKQLSTEDFTTLLKEKLEGLFNYDDSEIQAVVSKLRSDLDTLVNGNTTTAIETFNEIISFLDGLEDTENLTSIIASIEMQIASKQDTISDLDTIRSGAAKGATAIQSHQDISGKRDKFIIQNIAETVASLILSANTIYNCTSALTEIIISSFNTSEDVFEEYIILFKSGEAMTLSLPNDVYWANGDKPDIEPNTEYELSISKRIVDGTNIFKAILVPFKIIE